MALVSGFLSKMQTEANSGAPGVASVGQTMVSGSRAGLPGPMTLMPGVPPIDGDTSDQDVIGALAGSQTGLGGGDMGGLDANDQMLLNMAGQYFGIDLDVMDQQKAGEFLSLIKGESTAPGGSPVGIGGPPPQQLIGGVFNPNAG